MREKIRKILVRIKIILFSLLPLHFISKITYRISRIEERNIKNLLIRLYIYLFNISLDEYKFKKVKDYKSLNDFFVRPLDLEFRNKIENNNNIISPCDGIIKGYGDFNNKTFIHAKKYKYSIDSLIGDKKNKFENGKYINIYLQPKNCHRVYMPCEGTLKNITHIPGTLYSVAPYATENISNLYTMNERVVIFFDDNDISTVLIMIGAVNVGSISVGEFGIVCPSYARKNLITPTDYKIEKSKYKKGDEVGMFNLGSTVICLFNSEKELIWNEKIKVENEIFIRDEIIKSSSP